MANEDKYTKAREIAKRYSINLRQLEREQTKLAKQLEIKDSIDFNLIESLAACDNAFYNNNIISAVIICDIDFEILEQQYFSDKLKFPYISGFRSYRELPTMSSCFHKLEQKPDLIFVLGHGIAHPRLGLASHLSLVIGIPTIGIANNLLVGEVKKDNIILNGKKIGKVISVKPGSKPIYVSPGNLISVETAAKLAKKYVKLPHKLPEPMHLVHKYIRSIKEELT